MRPGILNCARIECKKANFCQANKTVGSGIGAQILAFNRAPDGTEVLLNKTNPFLGWTDGDADDVFTDWPVGTLTKKAGGFDWPGRVCGYNLVSTGQITVSVENRLSPGMVHVFPPHQLVREDRTEERILAEVEARML